MTLVNTRTKFWKWTKRIVAGLLVLALVLAILTYAAGAAAKSNLIHDFPPPGKLIDIGGYKMHLYCTGEGNPTVILEAGLNDFYVSWAKVQPEIAKVTRVCSYDRAGLGWSEAPIWPAHEYTFGVDKVRTYEEARPIPRTSENMAQELHALLDNAYVQGPYVLAGHSFGGVVMRTFAREYPDEVIGMVLVDSAHEEQAARLPFLKDAAESMVGQFRTLSTISSLGLMALSPESIPNRGFPDDAYVQYQAVLAATNYFDGAIAETTAFYFDATPGNAATPTSLDATAETTAFYFGAPSPNIAGLRDLPLIVLSHGLADTTSGVTPSQQEQFEREWTKMQTELLGLSSNSKQVIAHKSGHYVQLAQPELVVEAILELVQNYQK